MSEQPTATAQRPAGARGPAGKKYAGLTRNQWFIVGGVFVAALGYILWKRHQTSTAAASTAATNQGSNECTDQNGNPVDCNQAFASELADLANALDQLQAQGGGAGGSGVTGTVGTVPSTTPDTVSGAPAATQPSGTATSTGGTTATKTAPAAAKAAGAISGLKASNVTKTSFTASWNAAAGATGGYAYIVRNLANHTQTTSGTTRSTTVTISGLQSGVDYNFGIQGLPGGAGDNIHVRTT